MSRIAQPVSQIRLTNVSICRYRDGANVFEVACYPNKVNDWRDGREKDLTEVLQSDKIFTCVGKGQFARDTELLGTFGTKDWAECVRKILEQGTVQLSTKERVQQHQQFLTEVYTLAADRLMPLVAAGGGDKMSLDLKLTPEVIETLAKQAHCIPKPKNELPPKPCASRLAQKLAKAYPQSVGLIATRLRVLADPACECEPMIDGVPSAKLATAEWKERQRKLADLLERVGGFGVSQAAAGDVSFYIGPNDLAAVEAFCSANGLSYEVIFEKQAVSSTLNPPPTSAAETAKKPPPRRASAENAEPAGPAKADPAKADPAAGGLPPAKAVDDEDSSESSINSEVELDEILGLDHRAVRDKLRQAEKKRRARDRKQQEELKQALADNAEEVPVPQEPEPVDDKLLPATWCKSCKVDYATIGQHIRSHVKTPWHVFNHKRHLKNLEPVSLELFNSIELELSDNFLAVDY